MWVIKNRITNEYDHKGMSGKRNTVARAAWGTLGQAKCHVCMNMADHWYLEADFINISEDGTGLTFPVIDYIKDYLRSKITKCPQFTKKEANHLAFIEKYERESKQENQE
jgi:hypothetical protein